MGSPATEEERLKREARIQESLPHWRLVLGNFDKHKDREKTRKLWWLGLPPSVRGRLWLLALANDLNITPALYDILVKQAAQTRRLVAAAAAQKAADASPPPPGAAPPPTGDQIQIPGLLILGKMDSVSLIGVDLPRTFRMLQFFQEGGPYFEPLRNVLEAYVCYRPDLGYVQGMSYLVAVLLLNLEPPDAFRMLANLLNRPCQRAFYNMDVDQINVFVRAFDILLEEFAPKIRRHLVGMGLPSQMFLMDWFISLFAKSLPLDVACHIWDLVILEGEYFMFRAAIGLLRYFRHRLLAGGFDEAASLLTNLPPDINEQQLFVCISDIALTEKKYLATVAQCRKVAT